MRYLVTTINLLNTSICRKLCHIVSLCNEEAIFGRNIKQREVKYLVCRYMLGNLFSKYSIRGKTDVHAGLSAFLYPAFTIYQKCVGMWTKTHESTILALHNLHICHIVSAFLYNDGWDGPSMRPIPDQNVL